MHIYGEYLLVPWTSLQTIMNFSQLFFTFSVYIYNSRTLG